MIPMKRNHRSHGTMLVMVGCYVLYIAYQLFDSIRQGTDDLPPGVTIGAIVFFALAGIAVLGYAFHVFKLDDKEEKDSDDDKLTK